MKSRSEKGSKRTPFELGVFGILCFVFVWSYWPTLGQVAKAWLNNPDYTHGFLVVPIAAWLLYQRRQQAPLISSKPVWWGLGLILVAGLIRMVSGRMYLPDLDPWSIPLWVGGLVLFSFGWSFTRWAAPAIAFLWFATPLPGTIEVAMSGPLQQLAANCSGYTLRLIGQPAITEGTTVLLNEHVLDVERACSGLRMFYGIAALAVATVIVARPPKWQMFSILASTIPVAIIANVLRISVTGLLLQYASDEAARKFSHDLAGILMVPVGLGLFIGLLWLLKFLQRKFQVEEDQEKSNGLYWVFAFSGALLAVGLAVFFIERTQSQQVAETLKKASLRYQEEESWAEAVDYLRRYSIARPDDKEALVRLAEISRKVISDRPSCQRAIRIHLKAANANPNNITLWIEAAKLSYSIEDYETAVFASSKALRRKPDNETKAELIQIRAVSLLAYVQNVKSLRQAVYSWEDVVAALEQAASLPEPEVFDIVQLAKAYHQLDDGKRGVSAAEKAKKRLDGLVDDQSKNPQAWLARYLYYEEFAEEQSDSATHLADLSKAIELASQSTESSDAAVFLVAASEDLRNNEVNLAAERLQQAIKLAPKNHRAYAMLAELQRRNEELGGSNAAEETLREGLAKLDQKELALTLPLASILSEQGKFDDAEALLEPVAKILPKLVDSARLPIELRVARVRAEILANKQNLRVAIDYLRPIVASSKLEATMTSSTDLIRLSSAWMQLGQYYLRVESLDQATEAYRRAADLRPRVTEIRQRLAGAALQAGDDDFAQREFQEILGLDEEQASAELALASIWLSREMQKPVDQRDFSRPMNILQQALEHGADSNAAAIIFANIQNASGSPEEAITAIEKSLEVSPNVAELWQALARFELQRGQTDKAVEAANEYVNRSENPVTAISFKANLMREQGNAEQAKELLQQSLASASDDEHADATLVFAAYLLRDGDRDEAIKRLEEEFQKGKPDRHRLAESLAEYAWIEQNWDDLKKYIGWLEESEGKNGDWARAFLAHLLIEQATSVDSSEFEQAEKIVKDLKKERPRWPRARFLDGELLYRRGQLDKAIEAYDIAWRLGGKGILVADRMIQLLTKSNRLDEAQVRIAEMRELLQTSEQLFDRAVPLFAESEGDVALELTESWIAEDPNDPDNQLRFARVLMILADAESDAEKRNELREKSLSAFERALELAPDEPMYWISTILFLLQTEQGRSDASEIIASYEQRTDVNQLLHVYSLAQMYEAGDELAKAREAYRKTLEVIDAPETPSLEKEVEASILMHVARFYLNEDTELSISLARAAKKIDPANRQADVVLATGLSLKGDPQSAVEGIRLLLGGKRLKNVELSSDANRVLAVLLATRNEPGDVDTAIQIVEDLIAPTLDDQLLQARLYEQLDRLVPAWDLLTNASTSRGGRSRDHAELLRFWQIHYLAEEFESKRAARGTTASGSSQFVNVRNASPSDKLADRQAKATLDPDVTAALKRNVPYQRIADEAYGRLANEGAWSELLRWKTREYLSRLSKAELDRVEFVSVWEFVTKRMNNRRGKQAAMVTMNELSDAYQLFQVLIDEGQYQLAIELAATPISDWNSSLIESAFTIACMSAPPGDKIHRFASPFLQELAVQGDASIELQAQVGDYLLLHGDPERAIAIYEKVLEEGAHQAVENNIVLALLELPNRYSEAAKYISESEEKYGETAELLDTRALLRLKEDRLTDAIADVSRSIEIGEESALAQLHLAMILDRAGKQTEAKDEFLEARMLGLFEQWLTPSDREFVERFSNKVDSMGITD